MTERFDTVQSTALYEAAEGKTEAAQRRENYIAAMLGCSALYGDSDRAYTIMSQEEIQRAAAARRGMTAEA